MDGVRTYTARPAYLTAGPVKSINTLHKLFLGLLLILLGPVYCLASAPSGYSEYYMPGDEGNMSLIFTTLGSAVAPSDMHSVISVTAWSDNTTIYYDHWEDGYDFDPANPAATADEVVALLTAGSLQTFESATIPLPTVALTPVTGCSPTASCYYDGGDRIYVAGGATTVTRASWIDGRGAGNQAVAWEIYPVKPQLTTYVIPFGEDFGVTYLDFSRVYALIQATEDNTTVTIDLNGDGTPDLINVNRNATKSLGDGDSTTITLNRGETFLLDRISACTGGTTCDTAPGTLNSGTIIQGSSTLQLKFIAGRVSTGAPPTWWAARGFSAFPRGYWTKDYYAPLNELTNGNGTNYYLHNPNPYSITINWESLTGSGSFNIPAKTTVSAVALGLTVPATSGIYFRGTDIFWGVGSSDFGGYTYEWGFSLLPSTMLYDEHYLGWAPGSTTPLADMDDNGVFLIAAQDSTRVFVDFNNDGVADLIDTNFDGTGDAPYITLNRLQTQYFYDPTDGDMSQAHFWATGPFTMAYGQNSDRSPTGNPALDLGYVAIPGSDFVSMVMTVDKAANPQVVSTASGSSSVFTLAVNSQKYSLDNILVLDMLPANWQYLGSTSITLPDMTTVTTAPSITAAGAALPAPFTGNCPSGGGSCLTWDNTVLGSMTENQQITITFTAQTTSALSVGTLSQNRMKAIGTRTFGSPSQTQTFAATDFAYVVSGGMDVTKATGATNPVSPGDTIPYTVTVTNPSSASASLTGLSIYDPLPAGTSYVAGSGTLTYEASQNYRDQFGSTAYNNTNGSTSWTANSWTEVDAYGTVGGGANGAGGYVWITGGRLQFRYLNSTVGDQFGSAAYTLNTGSDTWSGNWTESATLDGSAAGTPNNEIYITGGRLRLDRSNSAANFYIRRPAAITTGSNVTIQFTPYDSGFSGGEAFTAEYAVDGSSTYNPLGTFDGGTGGWSGVQQTYTINNFSGSSITLQFRATGTWDNNNDHAEIDNVTISYNSPSNATGTQLRRTANLTGATSATLSFNYYTANLVAGDIILVEISSNGTDFTTLETLNGPTGSGTKSYNIYSPTNYATANTTVRFSITGGFNATNKTFEVDNLDITYTAPTTISSGAAPDFLSAGSGVSLAPGKTLTLTYSAVVDDPLSTGITEITNTAFANSNEIILPVSASITNYVVNPSSESISIGDRVWLDSDGDGSYDIGEPGLSNVEVTLKDSFGTPLMTTTTDASGHYLFTGVEPDNGYYVEVTSATLPSGLDQSAPTGHTDNRTDAIDLINSLGNSLDEFGVQAYTNSNGTVAWGSNWIENDGGGGGATGGNVQITGGEIRITENASYIYRDLNIPAGATMATLSFDWRTTGVETTDSMAIMISSDGGTTYTTLKTFTGITGSGSGHEDLDISSYLTGATRIRFDVAAQYTDTANDFFFADNVNVAYSSVSYGSSLNADLGYTAAGGTAVIGNQVWSDFNNNSIRDAGEVGIDNVTVRLYRDNNSDGLVDGGDTLVSTTTSAPDGTYLFTGVTASGTEDYIVSAVTPTGYIPTGSSQYSFPDVAAGSALLSADFGYLGDTVTTYTLQDRIWSDTDGDGVYDGGEGGLPGVTVELLDSSMNVIGTATTDANGIFIFTGMPGGDADYTIRVNDSGGQLTDYYGTTAYARAEQRAVSNVSGNVDYTSSPGFGFQARKSIGDIVYNDIDGNRSQGSGEPGMGGVSVDLYRDVDGDGSIDLSGSAGPGTVAVTNGSSLVTGTGTTFLNYHAGEPISINGVRYTIQSVANDTRLLLTTGYAGTTGSGITYNGPPAGAGTLSVTNGSPNIVGSGTTFTNYRAGEPISINNGGTTNVVYTILSITDDTHLTLTANYAGTTNGARTYYGPGDALLGSTTTDSGGSYVFSGLADRSYIIRATDPAGYAYTGPETEAQKSATLSGGTSSLSVDFGYQATTARTVSGTIWNDLDSDGVIDGGEAGLAGVTLDILSGSTVVASVTTNASGVYSMAGLASGTYTVRITDINSVLTDYSATYENGDTPPFDYQTSVNMSGGNGTANFGFKKPPPTLVTLSEFSAYNENGRFVVQWSTSAETDTAGFYLFRLEEKTGRYRQINKGLLPGLLNSQQGGSYSLIDNGASLTGSNTYLLMEVEGRGRKNTYGPFTVKAEAGNAVENQYSSGPVPSGRLMPEASGHAGAAAKKIRRYTDREGTIVITNGSAAHSSGLYAADEVSGYNRTPNTITSRKKEALNIRAAARAGSAVLAMQRTGSRIKLPVAREGLYFIDAAEIARLLGMTESRVRNLIRAGEMSLTNQGRAIAYQPAEDFAGLFFHGHGIASIYSNENIYWLARGRGVKMNVLRGMGPEPSATYGSFTEGLHFEEDRIVAPVLAHGPLSDYWFWDYAVAGDPSFGVKTFSIDTFGVSDTAASAALTVRLHGVTSTNIPNEHHVVISLNGTPVGEDMWTGAEERVLDLIVSQTLLNNGTNSVEVKGLLDTGVPYSLFFVNSFDLSYRRLLEANDDMLIFTAEGSGPLTVHGFTRPDLVVYDITEPDRPVVNMKTTTTGAGGNYAISFRPVSGRRYMAVAPDAATIVMNAAADSPSALRSRNNRADYIIITTSELLQASRVLAQYRQRQGHRTMVVDLEDIMDEFNFGISSPEAIRSFLRYAYATWRTTPRYVLLAGDGTYDYKDNMGVGDNLVPTLMSDLVEILSPSDNLYADVDDDHVPDIAIGRLPVLTAGELSAAISKIIAYEITAGSRIVMLADNPDAGGNFPSDSDDVAGLTPAGYSVAKIYLPDHTLSHARQLLFDELNNGVILLNYIGHAGVNILADEGLLTMSDAASMQNSGKPFLMTAMTCTVGNYALPGYESLSEALVVKAEGGAVAVWAPTGLTYNDLSKVLDENLFSTALGNRGTALGDVLLEVFRNYNATGSPAYVMDIYNLLGDPALRLW